jgi:hypothetical protein
MQPCKEKYVPQHNSLPFIKETLEKKILCLTDTQKNK